MYKELETPRAMSGSTIAFCVSEDESPAQGMNSIVVLMVFLGSSDECGTGVLTVHFIGTMWRSVQR